MSAIAVETCATCDGRRFVVRQRVDGDWWHEACPVCACPHCRGTGEEAVYNDLARDLVYGKCSYCWGSGLKKDVDP